MGRQITVVKRKITDKEAELLVHDIKFFPDLFYYSEAILLSLPVTCVVEVDGQFAGMCGLYEFITWIKIGPLVVLNRYQGLGLGRILLEHVVHAYSRKNLYTLSSNPRVQHVVQSLGFIKQNWGLIGIPWEVQRFLFKELISKVSLKFIKESIRKSFTYKRGEVCYFVRYNDRT